MAFPLFGKGKTTAVDALAEIAPEAPVENVDTTATKEAPKKAVKKKAPAKKVAKKAPAKKAVAKKTAKKAAKKVAKKAK